MGLIYFIKRVKLHIKIKSLIRYYDAILNDTSKQLSNLNKMLPLCNDSCLTEIRSDIISAIEQGNLCIRRISYISVLLNNGDYSHLQNQSQVIDNSYKKFAEMNNAIKLKLDILNISLKDC